MHLASFPFASVFLTYVVCGFEMLDVIVDASDLAMFKIMLLHSEVVSEFHVGTMIVFFF